MSNIYVKLFNIIFDNGCIPELWLLGNSIPLYKNKGDKLDASIFRPITIIRERPFNLKRGGGVCFFSKKIF